MKRVMLPVLVATLGVAACDLLQRSSSDDPTGPGPVGVARVAVSPESTVVAVGRTVRLNASILDEDGNPMAGKAAEWFTYDGTFATVDNAGNVTGISAGTATITASVDGKRGSARVRVDGSPGSTLSVNGVTPSPLVEGQVAYITGNGFGNVSSNLWVYVDGVVGKVSATNGTALQFTVPVTGKPARVVDLKVRLLTSYSNTIRVAVRP